MFVCTVLKPRNSFVLLSIERGLRGCESSGFFQIFVEPLSNQVVLFFFVRIKLPFLTQIVDSVEHSELHLRVLVDVSNHKSKVHSSTAVLILTSRASRSLLLRARKLRKSSPSLRMFDEKRKPLQPRLFLFRADDPPSGHPLVPRSLRTEEIPSCFVCAKVFSLFSREPGVLLLFVGIDAGFFCAACCKSFEACRVHQHHFCEGLDALDVNGAPSAGGPARSEANHVAGFIDALSNAVDPAEAEGHVYGLWPRDAGLPGTFFVEADE